jgi:hypothetical protein
MKYQRHMEIHKKIQKRSQNFVCCHISFKLNHYQKYRKATPRVWQQCMVSDIQKRSHTIGKCSKKSHQTDKKYTT